VASQKPSVARTYQFLIPQLSKIIMVLSFEPSCEGLR